VFAHPVFVPGKNIFLKQLYAFTTRRYVKHHKKDKRKADENWNRYAYLIEDFVRLRCPLHLTLAASESKRVFLKNSGEFNFRLHCSCSDHIFFSKSIIA